jgi:ubiquinone/menaquinone biosynthesis C-methylase UbiE
MKNFVIDAKRLEKAKKIESVLMDFLSQGITNKKILDIGTGNGEIAEHFSGENVVYSVDIQDQRINTDSGVIFARVNSEILPFSDNFFDIVISNHVIEHISNPKLHLQEIKRVLIMKGVCYLATPNRLFPWEAHYNLWFIHYLGMKYYDSYLKKRNLHNGYLQLTDYFTLKRMLKFFFIIKEYTHVIIKEPEKYGFNVKVLNRFPLFVLRNLNFLSQTNVFMLRK